MSKNRPTCLDCGRRSRKSVCPPCRGRRRRLYDLQLAARGGRLFERLPRALEES